VLFFHTKHAPGRGAIPPQVEISDGGTFMRLCRSRVFLLKIFGILPLMVLRQHRLVRQAGRQGVFSSALLPDYMEAVFR
jgi:hypothetical protein